RFAPTAASTGTARAALAAAQTCRRSSRGREPVRVVPDGPRELPRAPPGRFRYARPTRARRLDPVASASRRGGGPKSAGDGRSSAPAAAEDWISKLVSERRVLDVRIAGERRFIAAEDAGRYRDALGVGLPLGLPASFLTTDDADPLVSLLRRYARIHGPFVAGDPARRFGLAEPPVLAA